MQAAASASTPVEFGRAWLGQTVDGRFRLEQYLGGSDRHATFLTAREGAKAVIKLCLAGSCDAEAQLALWRRAAQLSHRNLLRVFESARCWLSGKELLYVVAEYADEKLADVLLHRPLSPSEADSMLRPTLEALAYLHGQGLLHGHLRPTNILAAGDQLKISSDGIQFPGKIVAGWSSSTYDAPEIAKGQLSQAADVWSLGVTLVEALTPNASRNGVPRSDFGTLPAPFDDIVPQCLKEDPSTRWTVNEISWRLQAGAGAASRQKARTADKAASRSEAASSKKPWLPVTVAVVAIIVVVAAILSFTHRSTNVPQTTPAAATASTQPAAPPANVPANSSGAVLNRVMPAASQSALRTIHGRIKVRIRASVDEAGNVTSTKFITAGSSKYFSRVAMQAAQQWKFTPPMTSGQPQPSTWVLLFEFTRGGMQSSVEPSTAR